MFAGLHRFIAEEDSPTMVEYAFLVAIIGMGMVTFIQSFRVSVQDIFKIIQETIEDAQI